MLTRGERNRAANISEPSLSMDCRVKPGNDEIKNHSRDASAPILFPSPLWGPTRGETRKGEEGGAVMIDHVSVAVRDLRAAEPFYTALLAPLGLTKLREWPNAAVGFGKKNPELWINRRAEMTQVAHDSGVHICLRAPDTAAVDAFHAAALKAGGKSDGAPGLRPEYHAHYYAAFVRDPDGNRIEAVTFLREPS
jgi:catechol 2,3-dioxygenase-like lactoylglutathione lyase family enzyme